MIYKEKEFILKNGMKVVFKTPEVTDAPLLLNNIIAVSASTDNLNSLPEDYDSFLKDITKEESFISGYRDGDNYLIAVYKDDMIIGSSTINFRKLKKEKHRSTVGIAIREEYQNLGIGSYLFDEMINIAKEKDGVEQIELTVISTNHQAKHLYTKKGFFKTGDLPRHLKLEDGSYLDGEKMVLFLDKWCVV